MSDPFSSRETGDATGIDQARALRSPSAEVDRDADEQADDQLYGRTSFPADPAQARASFDDQAASADSYPETSFPQYQPIWVPVPHRAVRNRIWLHALLFGLTILTTTLAAGLGYSVTILTILGAHELGHYLACRYYDIDASLPYFLPVPIPLTGTLGAFIRIREPIVSKRTLFDVGIAGPLAGFVFAVPALFIGVALSTVTPVPPDMHGLVLGEPLLLKFAVHVIWGQIPDSFSLNVHPIGFAAWFGLLATALNLFPIGQLDGGHVAYAVLKRHATKVTYVALAALLALNVVLAVVYGTPVLVLFTVLIVVMLFVFGPRHPPVLDEDVPLDRARVVLAVVALVIFILCFTPVPIRVL